MRPHVQLTLLYSITITLLHQQQYATAQTLLKNILQQQQNICNYDTIPFPPRNLVLIQKDGAIEAKWRTPINRPCDVTYEVRVFEQSGAVKMASLDVKETRIILYGYNDDTKYEVTVTARTERGRSAPTKATTAPLIGGGASLISGNFNLIPANAADWKCTGEAEAVICPAAASKLCSPMTCAKIAERGLCEASFMRITNWQKREMTQFCSGECGCPAKPSLRTRLSGPAADACCAIQTGEYFKDENGRSTNGIDISTSTTKYMLN